MNESVASDHAIDSVAMLLAAAAVIPLIVRRRWPFAVMVASLAAAFLYTARSYPGGPIYVATAFATFSYASRTSRRRGYTAALLNAAVLVTTSVAARQLIAFNDVFFLVWTAGAALVADVVRARRERFTAVAEREQFEQRMREDELERSRIEERLRLARYLHDSVAHAMAAINVQAGAVSYAAREQPGPVLDAFEAIRIASRDVLDELKVILDVLRDGDAAPLHPVAGLGHLEALVESSQRAGVRVSLHRGSVDGVPAPIGEAAYRVVQEALTNVARHAATDEATVTVGRNDGEFVVEVVDNGRGATNNGASQSGLGLLGIRERVAATGGHYEIGPRPEGGFRVRAAWDCHA
jgi:signal transduction histidine kinase